MKGIEKQVSKELGTTIETSENLQLSTIDRIKGFRKKVKLGKIAGIGLAGLTGLIYGGANIYKPQIAEYLLSSTYRNNTAEILKQFPENSQIGTTVESQNHKLKTFIASNGYKVHYAETTTEREENIINSKGKVLIKFPGINNSIPYTNQYEAFEKTVQIYYDSERMTPAQIKEQAIEVSEMINTNYGKYELSSFSTSFGGLFQSYIQGVKFKNEKTVAPFVGERAVVQAITRLPIPLIGNDDYDNFIKKPNPNMVVLLPSKDGITGGKDEITKVSSNVIELTEAEHESMGKGSIYHENQSKTFFPTQDKYTEHKQIQEKIHNELEVISKEHNSKSFAMFTKIMGKLDSIDPHTITVITREFKHPENNDELFPIEMHRFMAQHPLSKSIATDSLKEHEQNFQKYKEAKMKIENQ